ncbi:hypothetical protein HYV12_04075 [Candidatus Dojkabacteria bacterium]|nr:hypothetical protein [Candidatus Dojkabacteria bacterium]
MSLLDHISDTENIIVIASKVDSFDKAYSIIGLTKALNHIGKSVELLIKGKVSSVISDLFEKSGTMFVTDVRARTFEISVDYGNSSVEKIIYDDIVADKKLKFYITPGDGNFSFESVEMKEGGAKYGACIMFDIEDPKQLKKIYDQNEYLFKDIPTISIGSKVYERASLSLPVGEKDSYSEVVYDAFKDTKAEIGKEGVEILLNGIVNHRRLLEGSVSANSWNVITSMVSEGADLSKSLKEVYFSKTKKNADLQIKVMQNVKTNSEVSLIWSSVSKSELEKLSISTSEIDLRGRIPFNISQEYEVAIIALEVENDIYDVVVESNNVEKFSAISFAKIFGGNGDESHSQCKIKYWQAKELETKLIETIQNVRKQVTPE